MVVMLLLYIFQKKSDFPILPTKQQICAVKGVIFRATTTTMGVKDLPDPIQGGQVSLTSVLAWCIREMRLNKVDNIDGGELNFNLKLDGRPFWGKKLYLLIK
jgi:hypothetical protein